MIIPWPLQLYPSQVTSSGEYGYSPSQGCQTGRQGRERQEKHTSCMIRGLQRITNMLSRGDCTPGQVTTTQEEQDISGVGQSDITTRSGWQGVKRDPPASKNRQLYRNERQLQQKKTRRNPIESQPKLSEPCARRVTANAPHLLEVNHTECLVKSRKMPARGTSIYLLILQYTSRFQRRTESEQHNPIS